VPRITVPRSALSQAANHMRGSGQARVGCPPNPVLVNAKHHCPGINQTAEPNRLVIIFVLTRAMATKIETDPNIKSGVDSRTMHGVAREA